MIQHPSRSFALEITLDLVKGAEFFGHKPPIHFHVQEEYIESIQGKMGLELDGKEHVLSAGDGPMSIKPYVNHRSYPLSLAQQDNGETVVKFLLSGEKTDSIFELNPVFFENWYKYQDDVVVNGAKISLIQLFSVSHLSSFYPHKMGQRILAYYRKYRHSMPGVHMCHFHGGCLLVRPSRRHWASWWEDGSVACLDISHSTASGLQTGSWPARRWKHLGSRNALQTRQKLSD